MALKNSEKKREKEKLRHHFAESGKNSEAPA